MPRSRTRHRCPGSRDSSRRSPRGRSNEGVKRAEREAIMRQGVVLPETPRQRRERAGLEEDMHSIELRGKPLPVRPRLFRPSADAYLVATRGPLPYMLRLREIERATEEHEARLRDEWHALALECRDPAEFEARWVAAARLVVFDEVNDLIDRHNRWYPVESRLPMDPRRGDYALVNGRDYHIEPLDARWVVERFPPVLSRALS